MKRFFITTPIYYMNGDPHLGHYYATTIADMLARLYRSTEQGSFFLTGTDEHGQKVADKASAAGLDPQEYTDKLSAQWKTVWQDLDISYDHFVRTTDNYHTTFAQEVIQRLKDAGAIYQKEYEALYCVGAESFVTSSELREGGLCPDHDEKPQIVQETNWFFRLTEYKDQIRRLIETDTLRITPQSRKNEILEMLRSDIGDFSVTRERVEWGIPVPFASEQTIYVWIDALFNYMSAVIYTDKIVTEGRDIEDIIRDISNVWAPDVQIIGKDIIKFHAIYWPAFLLALGVSESDLPRKLLVTGMFVSEGRKMSKSLGNVVTPQDVVTEFDQIIGAPRGNDVLRYYIAREMMIGNDGDVTRDRIREVYQSDLVNKVGNTYQRVIGMASKYDLLEVRMSPEKQDRLTQAIQKKAQVYIETHNVYGYIHYIMDLMTEIGKGIETVKPWELAKQNDTSELTQHLGKWLSVLEIITPLWETIMPSSTQEMKRLLRGESGMLFPRIPPKK